MPADRDEHDAECSCVCCGGRTDLVEFKPTPEAHELIVEIFHPAYEELCTRLLSRECRVLDLIGHLDMAVHVLSSLRDETIKRAGE